MKPHDEHNKKLIANVHPPDWQNPEPQDPYQMVIIGAGTAGLVTAIIAAGAGAKVALVERHLMGGDCLNVGCVPSKGVISAARQWHGARNGNRFGGPEVTGSGDFAKAMERMRRLRADISKIDGAQRFSDSGVDVFLGDAKFVAKDAVDVGGTRLRFKYAVIATGARAAAPPIPGLDSVPYLTNENLFSLTELPQRFAIVGGGPIGCEMAQSFARFGSEVTLFDMAPHVLIREDADAARVVQESLVRDGVNLAVSSKILRIENNDGEKAVVYEQGGEEKRQPFDQILIAVGRQANIESLGLEAAGVEYHPRGVTVDDRLRTSNSKVFACGDVCSRFQFTHTADAQARIVVTNSLFKGRSKTSSLTIPWCTYTSPEIAHVGMYAKDAEEKGIEVGTITVPLDDVDRAILDGQDEGFLRIHYRKGSDEILGATLVAEHAGDMIGELCLAITHGIGLKKIASTIHPYPTQGEVIRKAASEWSKTRLTPLVSKIIAFWIKYIA